MINPARKTAKAASVHNLQEGVLVVQQASMEMIVNRNVMDVLVVHVFRTVEHAHTVVCLVSMVTAVKTLVPSVYMADVIHHRENVQKAVILASMERDVNNFVLSVLMAYVINVRVPTWKAALQDTMESFVSKVSHFCVDIALSSKQLDVIYFTVVLICFLL